MAAVALDALNRLRSSRAATRSAVATLGDAAAARPVLLVSPLFARLRFERGGKAVRMDKHTTDGVAVDGRQAMSLRLSNAMVRLYKDLFGRGPATARTYFAGPDCVIVTLEKSLTPAEQTMVELGELQRLRDVRLYFQHAREKDFRDTTERITGRRVRAFISGIDVEQDVASELFYLHPERS
jgi:uncharacterized protein YbcI